MTLPLVRPSVPLGGGVQVCVTTREGGVSRGDFASLNLGDHVGDDPQAVADNRARLTRVVEGRPIQWLRQVHGSRCVRATAATAAAVPEADAAWTDRADVALAVLTADCVPVVVAAPGAGVIGIAHAGWRGLVGGVLEALITALPVAPEELRAWIGPAIGPAYYQVDTPVLEAVAGMTEGARLVRRVMTADIQPGHYRFDLFELTMALLEQSGVTQVECARFDTFGESRWYSHRRATLAGEQTGRFATLVWRHP